MYDCTRWGWKILEEVLEAVAVRIHIGACDECRQKYNAIMEHIKELEKDAEMLKHVKEP